MVASSGWFLRLTASGWLTCLTLSWQSTQAPKVSEMRQLTYADRELLLRTFDSLRDAWGGSDDRLLADTCKFAALVPRFGFEHALACGDAVVSGESRGQDVAKLDQIVHVRRSQKLRDAAIV